MGKTLPLDPEVFLDTSYALALAAPSDRLHAKSVALAAALKADGVRIRTTQAVLFEIGNSLAKNRYRTAAVRLLESLQTDPTVVVVAISDGVFQRAWQLYKNRMDKEWGLIDCTSLVVMEDYGIRQALTADEHFEQAGNVALLRSWP